MLPFVLFFHSSKTDMSEYTGILGTKKFRQIETKFTVQPFEGLRDYRKTRVPVNFNGKPSQEGQENQIQSPEYYLATEETEC
jgi:hypothetical protein